MSDAMRVAIIGAGHLGTFHARVLARLRPGQPSWIVDLDEPKAAGLAAEVGARATADLSLALAAADAAIVATPTETHAAVATAALAAGCHVLVEKPLTATVAEGAALVDRARAARRVLRVGHVERFNPVFQAVRAEIVAPAFVEAERLAPFVPRSLDVDIVLDLMIHDLDLLLHIVPAPIESIDAVGVPVLTPREDIATARLRFTNGVVANLTASRVSQEKSRKIRFFSRNAYHSLNLLARSARRVAVAADPQGEIVVPGVGTFRVHEERWERKAPDPLSAEIAAFLDAAAGIPAPGVTGEEALRVLETAIEIRGHVRAGLARLASQGLAPGARPGSPRPESRPAPAAGAPSSSPWPPRAS